MRLSRHRLATTLLAIVTASLLAPSVTLAESPPPFPASGTDALARNSWIVTVAAGADIANAARLSRKAGGKLGLVYRHALLGFQFKGSAKAAAALAKNPRVVSVTPDRAIHLTEVAPNGIQRVRAWSPVGGAYQAGYRGAGARIAILDTGIDLDHPDLVASIDNASGLNCLNIALPPNDGHGHGTHVSGTAAAPLNGLGVVGVAPEAQLVAVKMFDDAGNSSEALSLCALDHVVDLNTDGNAANDIDVVNMSWGEHRSWGSCAADPLHGAICAARASGAILVGGAGNDAVDAGDFVPAAFPEVISVSGYVDFDGTAGGAAGCQFVSSLFWFECDDTMAFFSDYGPSVDVIAPGVSVYSTWVGGGYQVLDGTSMATPHVTGVVALMRAANPNLTATEALDFLQGTGECPNGATADADGVSGCTGQGEWTDDPDGVAEPLPNSLRAAQASDGTLPPPPPPPPPATIDIPGVQGDWVGTYGGDGYDLFAWTATTDVVLLPNASLTVDRGARSSGGVVNEPRVLESPDQTERRAGAYYDDSQVRLRLTFTSAYTGNLHLYALDYAGSDRRERFTVTSSSGTQVGELSTAFHDGAWLHFQISAAAGGSVTITVDRLAGPNVLINGLFLGEGTTTPPPATVPGAPTLNSATPGNGQVSLVWAAPTSDGGSAITGYTATASPGGATCSTSGSTTCTTSGLVNGTSYSFTVKATNAVGTGPASNALSATPRTVPGAPTLNSATSGNTQVALTWTAPASNGGSAITGYTATAAPGGATCSASGSTSCTVSGLTNGTSYAFTVTATNVAGTGPASNALSATPRAVPGAPTLSSATPGNGEVSLAWTAPASDGGSPITGYTATASPGGATCSASGSTNCTVSALTNGTSYSFTVTATNAAGTGPASNALAATPRTSPGAPTLSTATPGDAQVSLSWTAPASNGGSPITGYTATASPGGATCSSSASTTCTVSGLTNGTSYSFTVTATNAAGTGPASNALSATPRTVPSAPQNLTAAPHKTKGVNLAWAAPATNGGTTITNYRIYRRTAGGSYALIATVNASTLSYRDAQTSKGVQYFYVVGAVNAAGESPPSNEASAIAK